MPTVTVQNLIDRAKATADMRDNFVTPTQWLAWATQERLALDFFLARSGWSLPLTDFDIDVTGNESGAYTVNPTDGVMAIVCVYQYDTAGRIRMLRQQDAYTFLKRVPGSLAEGHSRSYRVQWSGDNLTLNMYPEPVAGETYRVVYIAHPRQLYTRELDYTDRANVGGLSVFWDDPGETSGYTVSLAASGISGAAVNISVETATGATYLYDTEATWGTLMTEINVESDYTSATIVGDADGLISETESVSFPLSGAALGATSVAYPLGWEERIVLGMARRALIKEESDTRGVDSEIALWESRIEEACWNRVLSNSPSVRNTDTETYGWTDRFSMPPIGNWIWP